MGCCFSRPDGPNAPYPGGAPSPSARAINSPPPPVRQSTTTEDSSIGGVVESSSVPRSPRPPVSVAASRQDEDARSHSHSNRHGNRHHSHAHHHHLHQHHHHGEQPPLSQHIDKPLRRHRWTAKKRAWTRTALDTERADFFDTRVTGRQEVWQILRAALEVLWEADLRRLHDNNNDGDVSIARDGDDDDVDDEDSDDDAANNRHKKGGHTAADESLATAQSILRAAEVTLPTGDLANGAYDPLGNYYALPEWIVSDPSNVAEDSGGAGPAARAADRKASERDGEASFDDDDDDGDDDEEAALRRREEKGKAVASVRNTVKVCARLSENGRDVVVRAGAEESVRSVARRVMEDSGLPPSKRIRLAYMGKILKENASLQAQGWQKGHVVNALVFNQ